MRKATAKNAAALPGHVTRWEAAEEVWRTAEQRARDYPGMIARGTITAAEAAQRLDRLRCAWLYVQDNTLALTSPAIALDTLALAYRIIEARRTPSPAEIRAFLEARDREHEQARQEFLEHHRKTFGGKAP